MTADNRRMLLWYFGAGMALSLIGDYRLGAMLCSGVWIGLFFSEAKNA